MARPVQDLPRRDASARAERAGMIRLIRSQMRAVRIAGGKHILSAETMTDRLRLMAGQIDALRNGLHRITPSPGPTPGQEERKTNE